MIFKVILDIIIKCNIIARFFVISYILIKNKLFSKPDCHSFDFSQSFHILRSIKYHCAGINKTMA